ncbi:D-alanyl-D-alanine carboxypeptidase family protein [Clostridiisalibacter paucivorans]|uniref:D-alanyl-D-alanine carboxypeptidase family protein n=1 Tax=Clostridiisalibacter paucivorans TaxID=408753 RepID=UPI00047D5A0F|nr:D-alanyl-D-alanine carboxypeptidase family protein [Clostridiisalibacter paucivorans]
MKKIVSIVFVLIIITNIPLYAHSNSNLNILGKSAILIDAETGNVLYQKDMHKKMYPASTTKIMTAILALENSELTDMVTVDKKSPYEVDGSHIALEPGEVLSMNDMLHALLIESANDAALVIARHISGSVEEFAKLMNKKAIEIGAKNTNFVNPNGLPDQNHTTTAYDLAMMARYAMQNKTFKKIVSNYKYTIPATEIKGEPRNLFSANRLLYGTGASNKINVDGKVVDIKYPDADGIKTGYTDVARNCLVSTAIRGDTRLIAVVLGAEGKNVYVDTHKLLNYGFDNFVSQRISFKNEFIKNIDVKYGDKSFVTAVTGQDVFALIPKDKQDNIKKEIIMGNKIDAPVTENQVLGMIEYKLDNQVIGTCNIIATSNINRKGIYNVVSTDRQFTLFKKWWFWAIILFILWRSYIGYKRYKRKKRKRQESSPFVYRR